MAERTPGNQVAELVPETASHLSTAFEKPLENKKVHELLVLFTKLNFVT